MGTTPATTSVVETPDPLNLVFEPKKKEIIMNPIFYNLMYKIKIKNKHKRPQKQSTISIKR
jgi:hypothetical protein